MCPPPPSHVRPLPNRARKYLLYAPLRLLQFCAPGPQSHQYRAPHLLLQLVKRRNRSFPTLTTHAPQEPSLIDLRVAATPSLVRVDTPPPLHARAVPPLVLEPASDQQHFAPFRKNARVAVRIVDGNAQSQCSATAYGKYGAAASATRERRKLARSQEQADATPASIALSSSAAKTQRVYCYAVASRAAEVQKNFGLLHTASSQENSCVSLAPLATSSSFAIAQGHRFKERVTECTSMFTLAPLGQIPVTARIASPSALNSARPTRDKLFTSRAPPARDDLLTTSVHSLSAAPPLVSACARSTSPVHAPSPSRAVPYSRRFLPAPLNGLSLTQCFLAGGRRRRRRRCRRRPRRRRRVRT